MLCACLFVFMFFFFKQKTAYEMRISDWSSDVCSSDLLRSPFGLFLFGAGEQHIDSQRDENACRKNDQCTRAIAPQQGQHIDIGDDDRSEEHTSELQSLMRISYAVFCLKKKKHTIIAKNILKFRPTFASRQRNGTQTIHLNLTSRY